MKAVFVCMVGEESIKLNPPLPLHSKLFISRLLEREVVTNL